MSDNRLEISSADVAASEATVVRNVDLTVAPGELHVLLGPNGSGKSSLLAAIMGLPPFRVTKGTIRYRGQRIDELPVDERARLGLGMAFQRPPSLDDVTVDHLAKALGADRAYRAEAELLDLADFTKRSVNVGFSGGEIKRWEILKLAMQAPQFLLFDEPESGVDLEHIAAVGKAVNRLVQTPGKTGERRSGLIITHTGFILDYVEADVGHIMVDGEIIHSGPANGLFQHIRENGYTAPAA